LVAFSEKQLNNLRNGLASGQVPANTAKAWITCRTCVGVQHHEMLCIQCDRVKGLEDFAKTQRRTPDMAVSWDIQHQSANNPRLTCHQLCKTCSAINSNEKPLEDKNKKTGEDDKESDDESDDDDSQSNAYGSVSPADHDLDND